MHKSSATEAVTVQGWGTLSLESLIKQILTGQFTAGLLRTFNTHIYCFSLQEEHVTYNISQMCLITEHFINNKTSWKFS